MKRHTWILIASAAITSISVAAPAVAAEPGFYFTAALGQAEEDPKSIGTNIGIGFPPAAIVHVDPDRVDVDDSGLAWSVAAGYRLNTYIAVEVEYMDFGTSDISEHYVFGPSVVPPFPSEFTNTYSSKVTGPAMSLLGSLPIGEVRGPSAPGSDRFGNCSVETPLSRCARSVSGASGQLLSGPRSG